MQVKVTPGVKEQEQEQEQESTSDMQAKEQGRSVNSDFEDRVRGKVIISR